MDEFKSQNMGRRPLAILDFCKKGDNKLKEKRRGLLQCLLFVSQFLRYLRLDNCNTEDSISGLKEEKLCLCLFFFEAKR